MILSGSPSDFPFDFPFEIVPATPADAVVLKAVEKTAFAPYVPRRDYPHELTHELAHYLLLYVTHQQIKKCIGAAGYWLIADELNVVTMAVLPRWRQFGLGEWLFIAMLAHGRALGATAATLEVRPGNRAARALYYKYGFQDVARRKRYYRDGEDALILSGPPLDNLDFTHRLASRRAELQSRLQKIEVVKLLRAD